MLLELALWLSQDIRGFNVFGYITLRTVLAALLARAAAPDFGFRRPFRAILETRSARRLLRMGLFRFGNGRRNRRHVLVRFLAAEDFLDSTEKVHGPHRITRSRPVAMQKNPRLAGGANLLTLCR